MRRAGAGLIAAVLALAGCKVADPKGDDKAPGGVAGRAKNKDAKAKDKDGKGSGPTGLSWLEDGKLPGAGTAVPRGGAAADPRDPNFDPKAAAQDAVGGRVLDPNG